MVPCVFEIERITVKIENFTNKARWVNKGLWTSSLNAQKIKTFCKLKRLFFVNWAINLNFWASFKRKPFKNLSLSTCSQYHNGRIFFTSEELYSKPSNSLSLFFIHVDIVFFETPNFYDASLLVIPFSISLTI